MGDDFPYRPQDRGFQRVVCHGGGCVGQQPDWWGNDYFDDTYLVDGKPEAFKGYCTDVFFDEAMRFVENNREQPFFCMISTNAPHAPFNADPYSAGMRGWKGSPYEGGHRGGRCRVLCRRHSTWQPKGI